MTVKAVPVFLQGKLEPDASRGELSGAGLKGTGDCMIICAEADDARAAAAAKAARNILVCGC